MKYTRTDGSPDGSVESTHAWTTDGGKATVTLIVPALGRDFVKIDTTGVLDSTREIEQLARLLDKASGRMIHGDDADGAAFVELDDGERLVAQRPVLVGGAPSDTAFVYSPVPDGHLPFGRIIDSAWLPETGINFAYTPERLRALAALIEANDA